VSVLVVGLSYRTAPLDLLERAALAPSAARVLEADLCRSDNVAEAVVLATCNRLEVYAEVSKFHGGVADVGAALAASTGVPLGELTDHLYVHYEGAAVTHLFTVAAGLDSMAVGEQQILGQVRTALRDAQDSGAAARVLGHLLQVSLRVGKRAHTETGLDRAAGSLVEAGIARGEAVVGPLSAASVLVVGAGAMSGLAVATLARHGLRRLAVANRTAARGRRLAAAGGGTAVPMTALAQALADADVVVSCTGAVGHVVTAAAARTAVDARGGRPQVYVDLALPRDVDPLAAHVLVGAPGPAFAAGESREGLGGRVVDAGRVRQQVEAAQHQARPLGVRDEGRRPHVAVEREQGDHGHAGHEGHRPERAHQNPPPGRVSRRGFSRPSV